MGTEQRNCKTAAVMNLLSRGSAAKREGAAQPWAVSKSGTMPPPRERIEYIDIAQLDDDPCNFYELSGLEELAANIYWEWRGPREAVPESGTGGG